MTILQVHYTHKVFIVTQPICWYLLYELIQQNSPRVFISDMFLAECKKAHLLSFTYFRLLPLLSERTLLECCCVHNMLPFISSSGLSPGSREAKIQRAKVCLNCTEPSVARSSCWSLPVGRYLLDTRCKGSMVVFARWTASNMAEEPQTSISHQVRERWTTSGSSDFRIWHMASIWYPQDLA